MFYRRATQQLYEQGLYRERHTYLARSVEKQLSRGLTRQQLQSLHDELFSGFERIDRRLDRIDDSVTKTLEVVTYANAAITHIRRQQVLGGQSMIKC